MSPRRQMGQFGASHAGAIERHQQCPSNNVPAVLMRRNTSSRLNTVGSRRWAGKGKKITELMALECLDEEKRSAATWLMTVPGVRVGSAVDRLGRFGVRSGRVLG